MYLLYIDDSGSAGSYCQYRVLAGMAIRENRVYWLDKAVRAVLARHIPSYPDVELHGTEIRTGRRVWHGIPQQVREILLLDVLGLIRDAYPKVIL